MRLGFTLLLNFLFVCVLSAQIHDESPFPADVVITAPDAIAGVYDYGTQAADASNPIWGVALAEDVSGELVWAFNAADSLGCFDTDPAVPGGDITTDLTGKIAFIRRGGCAFVDKVLNAQNAGAIGVIIVNHYTGVDDTDQTVFGMLGGDGTVSSQVTIPAAFFNRATGEIVAPALDAGETVNALFDVKSFFNATTAFSHKAPLVTYSPYAMTADFINPSETDSIMVGITAEVTSPSGEVTTLTAADNVNALETVTLQTDSAFVPTELGIHTVVFTEDASNEVLTETFEVTEFTFGSDDLAADATPISVGPSQEQYFVNSIYQSASLVLTDEAPTMATFASFGLGNPQDFVDPDTGEGEPFDIIVYKGSFDANATNFDLQEAVGGFQYIITGEEEPNELIYVEFEEPIMLDANEIYYVSIRKEVGNGGAIVPEFSASPGSVNYLNYIADDGGTIFATPLMIDQLYTGWNNQTVITRLHLDGFVEPVDTVSSNIEILADNQVSISPNPVQEQVNLSLNLGEVANDVQVGILGVDGRKHGLYSFDNVTEAPLQIEVADLKAGTYFLSIQTSVGYRMVKFIKQ